MSGLFTPLPLRLLVVLACALGLAGCGGSNNVVEKRSGQANDRDKRDLNQGLGGRTQEDGTLFGPGGLFGSKPTKRDDSGTGVAVNAYLWRASLDTINFIPLVSADPFGGVI